MDPDALVNEQVEYYKRRAGEYDATSSPDPDPLAPFGVDVLSALERFGPTGDVLEIASGTGSWTRLLLEHARQVTALDAAAEMHVESVHKLGSDPRVRYIEADVFSWIPDRRYDVVFFANWLSHVPLERFEPFWSTVGAALKPDGRVFVVDESKDALSYEPLREALDFVGEEKTTVVRRPLLDGTTFSVVKILWQPAELRARLQQLGWDTEMSCNGPFFWVTATLKVSDSRR